MGEVNKVTGASRPVHMLPYSSAPPTLPAVFDEAGIDMERPLVASCGSGITACIVAFAAHMLGKDVPVYDVRMM